MRAISVESTELFTGTRDEPTRWSPSPSSTTPAARSG